MCRPPSVLGWVVRAAPCAVAMARTMDRPSPCPSRLLAPGGGEPLERAGQQRADSRRAGWPGRCWRPTGRRGRAAGAGGDLRRRHAGALCRTALSRRLAASRSIRSGSPQQLARGTAHGLRTWSCAAPGLRPRPARRQGGGHLGAGRRARGEAEAGLAGGQGEQRLQDALLLQAPDCRSSAAGGCATARRWCAGCAARARSRVLSRVSGVRSSWAGAWPRSCRWAVNEASSRVEQAVEGVGELLELVVRAGQGEPLVQAGGGDGVSGRGDGAQRAQHPPDRPPASRARTTSDGHDGQRGRGPGPAARAGRPSSRSALRRAMALECRRPAGNGGAADGEAAGPGGSPGPRGRTVVPAVRFAAGARSAHRGPGERACR